MTPMKDDATIDAPAWRREEELPDDPRLMQAVQEYLRQLEAGRLPDRGELLRRYADIAGPLAKCLDGLDLVHQAAVPAKQPTLTPLIPPSDDPHAGSPLGDFQILREIGRGGMGVVYEALQLSLGRRVALKVLPFAAAFDARHLQRFQNEARHAALLHHTNIVPVFAVGCERGVHFYAMQLIEGHTLAEVIRLLRCQQSGVRGQESGVRGQDLAGMIEPSVGQAASLASNPASEAACPTTAAASPLTLALTTHRSKHEVEYYRTVARFMLQAAEALEHAHQYGIVHRDIKPANLMLDELGRLWITDFGLAQFHADASLTQTGDILGTLRYMSPEQAGGQRLLLDHRTDVYSLGATMYELATLEPMFAGQDRNELLRQIIQEEPRPPRALDPNVPVELETIILKAVAKNSADRYASAHELAADLQRYLDDKPILAKRPSIAERARKWARRHPSAVIAALILLFLGAIGFAVSTALIAREQALTKNAYDAERKKAEEAEQRFQLARRSADEMILLAEEELADNPAMQNLRRRLLEAALSYYQEFIELRSEDKDAQAELASTRDRVRTILHDLAVLQGAGQQFLLKDRAVLDDMKLSEDQRTQMESLTERMDKQRQEAYRDFYRLAADERQKRALELARTNDAAISDILYPPQLTRLRQIALQSQGAMAFLDPDVAAALKLTSDQKKQIRGITALVFFEKGPFGRPPGGKPGKFFEGKPKEEKPFGKFLEPKKRTELKQQILALLTPEQTRVWSAMIGEPFVFRGPPFGPPGGMRPPPDDGGFRPVPKDYKGR